jgi:hypothetical protein
MAVHNVNKGRKTGCRKHSRPDLYEILARFSDARSFLECGVRLVEERGESGPGLGDESVCLRHGLDLFVAAYKELDSVILSSDRQTATMRDL